MAYNLRDGIQLAPRSCVLLLIVIFAVWKEVPPTVEMALSPHWVIVLSVATSAKVSTEVARVSAEPPLLDIVFEEAAMARFVKAPEVWR